MNNKFCPSCGQEVKDSGSFCINCGYNLNNNTTNNNVVDNSHVNNNSAVYNDFNNINPETMTMNNQQNMNQNYNMNNVGSVNEFKNTSAIVGLVLGIISLLCCCSPLFGGVGLAFSINGLNKAKLNNNSGKGMAIAGMVMSIISLVGFVFAFILSIFGEMMA